MNFIKNNYMKFFACLIWILGIPAGYALGYRSDVSGSVSGIYYTSGKTKTEFIFSWTQASGYWAIFFALGFIAFLLAMIFHNQKKREKRNDENL